MAGRTMRAGPLELEFSGGDLRRIRLDGVEILSRIYMAVRDRNWNTVAGRIEKLVAEQSAEHFSVTYDSVHQQGEIDFRWRATITGTEAGKITFAMDGRAHSTFLRNRIGFCVHHPLRECAGKPCLVETADGHKERSVFPEFVAPHQPFLNVRAMTHEAAPGVQAEVRFHGDVFETEDHRNWTDANFKTYGTPLSLPFPVEVRKDSRIQQMVELTLHGRPVRSGQSGREDLVELRVPDSGGVKLPALGLGMASDGRPLTADQIDRLKKLRLGHVRVDLPSHADAGPLLRRAAEEARALDVKLEVALTLPVSLEGLKEFAPLVARWLVYDEKEKSTGGDAAKKVRDVLGPESTIVVGTNAYFAELNRNRPTGTNWDAACFSVNPQVHAFDDLSVMENTAAQADVVRSARRFLNGKPVVVSPVTLRPRSNPDATAATEAPPPDPRQKQQFCAAWTVASLKSLAEAGAASVTYFETRGAAGVLDDAAAYPVYGVFEAVGEFVGGETARCVSSDGKRVIALLLASGARRRMLLANLTDARITTRVEERLEPVELGPYAVERIDWIAE